MDACTRISSEEGERMLMIREWLINDQRSKENGCFANIIHYFRTKFLKCVRPFKFEDESLPIMHFNLEWLSQTGSQKEDPYDNSFYSFLSTS
jgi:hypothetical protein